MRKELEDFCYSHKGCIGLLCPLYDFASNANAITREGFAKYYCAFRDPAYPTRDIRKAHGLLEQYQSMGEDER